MKTVWGFLFVTLVTQGADSGTARDLSDRASQLYTQSRYAEAEPLFRQAVEAWAKLGKDAELSYAIDLRNLGALLRAVGRYACGDQILDDFVLCVDGDRMAGEFGQRDAPALSFEGEFETVMHRAFDLHPCAESGFVKQVHGALFENAGTDGGFDFAAAACLEHDRFDTAKMEQMREQKARRARTDNADLCTHECLRNAC